MIIFFLIIATPAETQTTELSTLSYQMFDQLAQVYSSGGTAPGLVAQMNNALGLIEEARVKRVQGDTATATQLENQARALITQLTPQVSAAQQEAAQNSTSREELVSVEAALMIGISTVAFYGSLIVWRWYEKEKLFERKIVAEGSKD